jgi:hypothetical protein
MCVVVPRAHARGLQRNPNVRPYMHPVHSRALNVLATEQAPRSCTAGRE